MTIPTDTSAVQDAPKRQGVVAIIPARGGSKGIPGKNLKQLGGKPLLAYAIAPALAHPEVDRVLVSTDDEDIKEAALALGAEVPFMRPAELAQDHVPDRPVFQHALRWLARHEQYHPAFVLNLRCTTPFKTTDDIGQVISTWQRTSADAVRTMSEAEGVHHPYWMFSPTDEGMAQPFIEGISLEKYYQRQLLPPAYRLNGLVDGIKAEVVLHHEQFYGSRMALVPTPVQRSHDIDTPLDFKWAEFLIEQGYYEAPH